MAGAPHTTKHPVRSTRRVNVMLRCLRREAAVSRKVLVRRTLTAEVAKKSLPPREQQCKVFCRTLIPRSVLGPLVDSEQPFMPQDDGRKASMCEILADRKLPLQL